MSPAEIIEALRRTIIDVCKRENGVRYVSDNGEKGYPNLWKEVKTLFAVMCRVAEENGLPTPEEPGEPAP